MCLNQSRHCHLPPATSRSRTGRAVRMPFTPVGVLHAAQHQLHQNLRENQEDARGNFLYFCFCLYVEERIRG